MKYCFDTIVPSLHAMIVMVLSACSKNSLFHRQGDRHSLVCGAGLYDRKVQSAQGKYLEGEGAFCNA